MAILYFFRSITMYVTVFPEGKYFIQVYVVLIVECI